MRTMRTMRTMRSTIALLLLGMALRCHEAFSQAPQEVAGTVRIKDLVEIRGVRSNPLIGMGLVVGLAGTGDSKASLTTNQATSNLLTRLGSVVSPQQVITKNIAAVVVTAELPPFARIGDRISVRVSSVGDAASLEGGTLLLTPLSAADDQVYAVVQGALISGSGMAGGQGGIANNARSSAPKTVALANAATVEREFEQTFINNNYIELSLRRADFTTATRIGVAVNSFLGEFAAEALNAGLIKVRVPNHARNNKSFNPVAFLAAIEQLRIEPDSRALVIINERTGTVIAGERVAIRPVTVSHGGLEISVKPKPGMVGMIPLATTVGDLVSALNALGAGPRDLVAILQALDAAHALEAQLQFL